MQHMDKQSQRGNKIRIKNKTRTTMTGYFVKTEENRVYMADTYINGDRSLRFDIDFCVDDVAEVVWNDRIYKSVGLLMCDEDFMKGVDGAEVLFDNRVVVGQEKFVYDDIKETYKTEYNNGYQRKNEVNNNMKSIDIDKNALVNKDLKGKARNPNEKELNKEINTNKYKDMIVRDNYVNEDIMKLNNDKKLFIGESICSVKENKFEETRNKEHKNRAGKYNCNYLKGDLDENFDVAKIDISIVKNRESGKNKTESKTEQFVTANKLVTESIEERSDKNTKIRHDILLLKSFTRAGGIIDKINRRFIGFKDSLKGLIVKVGGFFIIRKKTKQDEKKKD